MDGGLNEVMRVRRLLPWLAVAGLAGCATAGSGTRSTVDQRADNRRPAISSDDARRLHDWRDALVAGRADAASHGGGEMLVQEGALLLPDVEQAGARLPVGNYRCRTIKLGARGAASRHFAVYPVVDCLVTSQVGHDHFATLAGAQRLSGVLFENDLRQKAFAGAVSLKDEAGHARYGQDVDRNAVGVMQQLAPNRWRLVMPYPAFESVVDVVEIVAAH